ncbi:hypothetical protein V8C86DRAFT_2696655 [Haematococcus lacustris]
MLACAYGVLAPRTMRRGPARTACRAVNFENELFARQLQGKSFLCTQCGKCCTGEGEVWVSSEELLRISEHLHLTPQAFQRRYTEKHSGCKGWHLLLTKGEEQNCVFLQDKQCSIHAVRPRQCATYPWWPELMDPADWQREKDNICEGFDHPDAPVLDVGSAAAQLKQATHDVQVRTLLQQERKDRI